MGILDDMRARAAAANATKAAPAREITLDNFDKFVEVQQAGELETIPRATVIRMLQTTKLDVNFAFKTAKHCGMNYILAMRAVMSRVRGRAIRDRVKLEEFKLYVVKVETKELYDEVVLVRTKSEAQLGRSLYGAIFKELVIT